VRPRASDFCTSTSSVHLFTHHTQQVTSPYTPESQQVTSPPNTPESQQVTSPSSRPQREQAPVHPTHPSHSGENSYFTEMCSGSEAGSCFRRIDVVYHSTLGLRVIKKKKRPAERAGTAGRSLIMLVHEYGRVWKRIQFALRWRYIMGLRELDAGAWVIEILLRNCVNEGGGCRTRCGTRGHAMQEANVHEHLPKSIIMAGK